LARQAAEFARADLDEELAALAARLLCRSRTTS
jgi:hypothetical protein